MWEIEFHQKPNPGRNLKLIKGKPIKSDMIFNYHICIVF